MFSSRPQIGDSMNKTSSTDKVRNYLESLTKDELIALILKLAPQSFIDNINSQFASKKEALTIFNTVSKTIDEILLKAHL